MPGIQIFTDGSNYYTQRGLPGGGGIVYATPQFIQSAANSAYGAAVSSQVKAFGSNNTAGNMLVVTVSNAGTNINNVTISDTLGNVYILLYSDTTVNGDIQASWYALNCKGGANTVTVSWTTGAVSSAMVIEEYSGVALAGALDQTLKNTGSSTTTWSTGTIQTQQASELVLLFVQTSGGGFVNSSGSWTNRQSFTGAGGTYSSNADQIASNFGNFSASGTSTSGNFLTYLASFRAAIQGGIPGTAPTGDAYVLGVPDYINLPNSRVNPTAYYGVDAQPIVAGTLDDEFNGTALNLSRWTWVNQGGSNVTVQNSFAIMHDPSPAASAANSRYLQQPAPTAPWTILCKITALTPAFANNRAGIFVSDGTKFYTFTLFSSSSSQWNILLQQWATATSTSATNVINAAIVPFQYLIVQNDGTNLKWSVSLDGINPWLMNSAAITAFLASASFVGINLRADYNTSGGSGSAEPAFDAWATFDFFRRTQ